MQFSHVSILSLSSFFLRVLLLTPALISCGSGLTSERVLNPVVLDFQGRGGCGGGASLNDPSKAGVVSGSGSLQAESLLC